jgi:predicted RNA-binding protein with RPS1 domain
MGSLISAYVVHTSSQGCFIRSGHAYSGRVLIKDLSDSYVNNPSQQFSMGKLIKGRVMSVNDNDTTFQLSLRSTDVMGEELQAELAALTIGQVISGMVHKVTDFGVFIALENSNIIGLSRAMNAVPREVRCSERFSKGDMVRARVLQISTSKLSLGLKEHYFRDGFDAENPDEEEEKLAMEVEDEEETGSEEGDVQGSDDEEGDVQGSDDEEGDVQGSDDEEEEGSDDEEEEGYDDEEEVDDEEGEEDDGLELVDAVEGDGAEEEEDIDAMIKRAYVQENDEDDEEVEDEEEVPIKSTAKSAPAKSAPAKSSVASSSSAPHGSSTGLEWDDFQPVSKKVSRITNCWPLLICHQHAMSL